MKDMTVPNQATAKNLTLMSDVARGKVKRISDCFHADSGVAVVVLERLIKRKGDLRVLLRSYCHYEDKEAAKVPFEFDKCSIQ
ncbi:MAG: hypothetical protein AAF892_11795 [Cyanobacteria bacterium P01_D01_bin.71]